MPPRLPIAFWMPLQELAASDPARVWVTAHTLEVNSPRKAQLTASRVIAAPLGQSGTGRMVALHKINPVLTNIFLARETLAPEAMRRSDTYPPASVVKAMAANGSDPRDATS